MVGNVILGTMLRDGPSQTYLLACKELPKCNHRRIAKLVNDALSILWPSGIKYKCVFLCVSDVAPYMIKAGACLLQSFYHKTALPDVQLKPDLRIAQILVIVYLKFPENFLFFLEFLKIFIKILSHQHFRNQLIKIFKNFLKNLQKFF